MEDVHIFIFDTLIAYCVLITIGYFEDQYDIESLGSRADILKACLGLATQFPLSFLGNSAHIWHNNCLWCVDYNNCYRSCYSHEVNRQAKMLLKSV